MQAHLSDRQFYLLKISRLESDLALTQQELISVKLRLRAAEDYQIKYELLLKQTEQQSSRMRMYEREEEQKIAELITLRIADRDNYWSSRYDKMEKSLSENHQKQLTRLSEELQTYRKKAEKVGTKVEDQDVLIFKNKKLQKDIQTLQEKITEIKKEYERNRQEELKTVKQSLTNKNKQKQENERKIYRQKIQNLENTLKQLQLELLDAKSKANPDRQNEINKLKSNLIDQMDKNTKEIQKLNAGFQLSRRQVQNLLQQKRKIEQILMNEKKQLRKYIKSLEDKLYQNEREHELQLLHLKQRMTKIRQDEANGFKEQINKIYESFNQQKKSWDNVLLDKQKQTQRMKNKLDEDTQRHKQDKMHQLKKIQDLKNRLKQYEGDREVGETELLLKSLKDIESKQNNFNDYESGVTFLDRQLKKSIAKVEQKNIQINKLVKQLNDLRKQFEDESNSTKQKARKDKKYYLEKINQLEQDIRNLNQKIRLKDREAKKKQRDLETTLSQVQKQNNSLKDLVDEMQKDYTRVVDNKKVIEGSYRQERDRGLTSKSDLTMVRKQKWLQMQKQKNQLQVIYKEKEQQIKNKHEVEVERLRHQRDELKGQNQILKGAVEISKTQSDQSKQNKQELYSDYHKKMATLDLQIALTKNIYDSLIQARSRKPKNSRISEFDRIQSDASHQSEQRDDQIGPMRQSKNNFFNTGQFGNLAMSFNPNQR